MSDQSEYLVCLFFSVTQGIRGQRIGLLLENRNQARLARPEHFTQSSGVIAISISPSAPLASNPPTRSNNSRLGVILMLCAMFVFAAGDALAKLLTDSFHPVQIIWFRQSGLLFGVLIILCFRGLSILKSKQPALQMSRGALVVFSSLLFVYAVRYVPLADAVAASFVAPFFVTILGAVLLKEKVGIRRWSAVVIGFIGALIIVRPGMGVIHPAVLLVVLAAALFAARQVIGRLLADTDKTITTIAYTALVASLLISLPLPFVWQMPDSFKAWMLLASMAIVAAVGEILVIRALEIAEAAVVAPIHYTIIVWATIYGFFVFNQLPDYWTLVGTAIIVFAGVYTLKRGRLREQTQPINTDS